MDKETIVSVKNVDISKNTLGLSDGEALYLLDAILTSYSEGFDTLRGRLPESFKNLVDSVDEVELLNKLGISVNDYDKFTDLMF